MSPASRVDLRAHGWWRQVAAFSLLTVATSCASREERSAENGRIVSAEQPLEAGPSWVSLGELEPVEGEQLWGRDLAATGDTAIVVGQGARAYRKEGAAWTESQELFGAADAGMVTSVALTGGIAVLGVDDGDLDRLLVFSLDGDFWSSSQTITQEEMSQVYPALGIEEFGGLVALSDTLLVAAGSTEDGGATVLSFGRTPEGFVPAGVVHVGGALPKRGIAISGDTVLVGVPDETVGGSRGVILAYERHAEVWQEVTKLRAQDGSSDLGLGLALAADGERVVAGTETGAAFVFERTAVGFSEALRLAPPTAANAASESVAIAERAIVVGLPMFDASDALDSGGAFMAFATENGFSAPIWLPRARPFEDELLGLAVALTDDMALVGAPLASTPLGVGRVAVFGACESDGDCEAGSYCGASGECLASRAIGEGCDRELDCREPGCAVCQSSFCTDGVCCESACDGRCSGCAQEGHAGECRAVTGAPVNGRPGCGGEDVTCSGYCDGRSVDCVYPAPGTACGSGCSDGIETSYECDGVGSCKASEPRACGGFACADGSCRSRCGGDRDCVSGFACIDAACVPTSRGTCSADGNASSGLDGTSHCAPYRCDADTGLCRLACDSAADCADGYVCLSEHRACAVEIDGAAPQNGCSCSLLQRSPTHGGAFAAFVSLLWVLRTRRSSCRGARS